MKKYTHKIAFLVGISIASFSLTSCDKSVLEEPLDAVSAYKILEDETTLISGRNVQFVNTLTGYTVGDAGKIIKTSDGGVNWDEQVSGITTALFGLSFINEKVGWIAGTAGVIKKTTDGGLTWTDQVSGLILATDIIYSIEFRDANNGVAAATGSRILTTTDGGTTWKITKPLNRTIVLRSAKFLDEKTIFATGGSGVLLKSINAGVSYDTTQIITNGVVSTTGVYTTQTMLDIKYPSKKVAYINGGSGWVAKLDIEKNTYTLVNPTTSEAINSLSFINENELTGVSNFGLIYKTTDGGSTWRRIKSGTGVTLTGVSTPANGIEFIVGSKVILKSK